MTFKETLIRRIEYYRNKQENAKTLAEKDKYMTVVHVLENLQLREQFDDKPETGKH